MLTIKGNIELQKDKTNQRRWNLLPLAQIHHRVSSAHGWHQQKNIDVLVTVMVMVLVMMMVVVMVMVLLLVFVMMVAMDIPAIEDSVMPYSLEPPENLKFLKRNELSVFSILMPKIFMMDDLY